ncbi:MAG: Hpt domain-containing protein [Bacteroidetes bacterium]|nr:Hpt domain-containing protein [Bacteroidales bacterium]MBU1009966.1 Hpt domain-containing protein [Bacteroidota bacterium]
MTPGSDKIYRLNKLIEFIGDDTASVTNMVGVFLHSTPDLVDQIRQGFADNDLVKVGKAAHMLKPTLDIFGIDSMYDTIRAIELNAKNMEHLDQLGDQINALSNELDRVYAQIKTDFPTA